MNVLANLVGQMRYNEIITDVSELTESKSYIHLDELIIKYGEIGVNELIVFMIETHKLKYFKLNSEPYSEPNLYYSYYLKYKDEFNSIFSKLLLS